MIYEINVNSSSYFYTNKTKLNKAEVYLKSRNIEYEIYIHEKNYDFGEQYHYEVEICLSNNKIKSIGSPISLNYDLEIWNVYHEYKNPEHDDYVLFSVSSNDLLEEEDLMMIYFTYIEDGIVDDAIDRYTIFEEKLERKRSNSKFK